MFNILRFECPTKKGTTSACAYLRNDEDCLPKISNQKWKLTDPDHSDWYDAGNNLKIRCGYKPKGISNNILYAQGTKSKLFLHFSTHF